MSKIFIGRFYMKSGSVIPFAATKLEFRYGWDGLKGMEYNFVRYKGIRVIHTITVPQIEAVVIDDEVEDDI